MDQINWGIIGCGDVTEVKSGPAFNKVKNSRLVAVMRRDGAKAEDYARRHGVPKWYDNADALIADPQVNAIYIATPPSSHEELTYSALAAKKPVYLEKPMALDAEAARNIRDAASQRGIKISIAHYRRGQPFFKKVKELVNDKIIGDIRYARLDLSKRTLTADELSIPKIAWRVDPSIAGGGLFHDLAPHQLDLARFFFGEVKKFSGISTNQAGSYNADDIVGGTILFENGILFNGTWCFTADQTGDEDKFEITGTKGRINFSVFGEPLINLIKNGKPEVFIFDPLQHVQQPLIGEVVDYFLGKGPNPCTAEDGVKVMELMEAFTRK